MSKIVYILIVLLGLTAFTSCHPDKKKGETPKIFDNDSLPGDETVYGLACEGCSDTSVVLLPEDCSDPVTYNCWYATRHHKVLGKLQVGDWIAVVPNKKDKKVADIVIDLDELKGIWCYIVFPRMKGYENMDAATERRLMQQLPDSVKRTTLIPREYGFWMKRQWVCQSVGYVREQSALEEESPVVYQPLGYFTTWRIWNGKLIITSGKPKQTPNATKMEVTDLFMDTCDIDYLRDDSLVLSDRWGTRSYYRKKDINDVNKRAIAIAAQKAKEALEQTTATQ